LRARNLSVSDITQRLSTRSLVDSYC
jgi:hypothetical protein